MKLRWGIASSGRISHDFVCAVQTLPKENHEITVIAARTLQSAETFAKSHNIPKFLEGYEALAKSADVDIVYVGVINTQHLDVAKMMLQNGKHVLCEKPLTVNKKQTQELLEYAKSQRLYLMEAIWSRCFPIYKELRKQLDSGAIGDILYTHVTFGFNIAGVTRVKAKELGGGSILDLGVYTLQFNQFVYKGLKPIKLIGTGNKNSSGVDETANAIITYPGNKTATIAISALTEYPNEALIVGTKGTIRMPNFWCPTTLITPTGTIEKEVPKSPATFNFNNSSGLSYEAEETRQCIEAGMLENPTVSMADSLELSELMDAWRKEIGVVYDVDN